MKKRKKNVQNEEEKKEKCKIKKSVLTMPESCWDRCMTTQREELPNSLKTLMSGSLEASSPPSSPPSRCPPGTRC